MILCWFFAPFVNEAAKSYMKERDKSPKNTENFWKKAIELVQKEQP